MLRRCACAAWFTGAAGGSGDGGLGCEDDGWVVATAGLGVTKGSTPRNVRAGECSAATARLAHVEIVVATLHRPQCLVSGVRHLYGGSLKPLGARFLSSYSTSPTTHPTYHTISNIPYYTSLSPSHLKRRGSQRQKKSLNST